jgi:hypothetical protein
VFETLGGEPVTAPYVAHPGQTRPARLPAQLVKAADWGGWRETPREDVRLLDWGETRPIEMTWRGIALPVDMRSPEGMLVGYIDYRHDLWRAGVVVGSVPRLLRPLCDREG